MTIFEKGRRGYRRYLLGEAFDPTTPDGRSVVQSVELVARGTPGQNPTGTMFESPSLPLYARALAYRTPGTAHYGEPAERDALLAQLDAMNAHYNRDTPATTGGWSRWGTRYAFWTRCSCWRMTCPTRRRPSPTGPT